MSLSQAEKNLRDRLLNCRKRHYDIPQNELTKIRSLLRNKSVSKKVICTLYGITYGCLKEQLNAPQVSV